MKNLKIVLFLSVAVLMFSCKPGSNKDNDKGKKEVPTVTAPAGSIVFVNLDSLFNNYDMSNDLRSELEAKITTIQSDLTKQGRDFEGAAKDFEAKVKKGLLTQSQAELQNRQLAERQQGLQQLSQQKQMEISEEQQVMNNRIMDAIKTFIAKYNDSHNYALILTTSVTVPTVLEGDPSLDVTLDVLNGLNEEYVKTKKQNTK